MSNETEKFERLPLVHVIARETQGDPLFFKRWETVGIVYRGIEQEVISRCDILHVDFRVEVTDALLDCYPNLKIVSTATTGLDHIKANLDRRGITLISLNEAREDIYNIRSVSEHVFNLLFRLIRPLNGVGQALQGRKILILGYNGRIGGHVFDVSEAFGLETLGSDEGTKLAEFHSYLSIADIVTIHIPLNDQTRNIIGIEEFNYMKNSAILINTSRPEIVDIEALGVALNNRKIAGAAFDFMTKELMELRREIGERLVLSDHVGGNTLDARIRTDSLIVKLVQKRFKELKNLPRFLN